MPDNIQRHYMICKRDGCGDTFTVLKANDRNSWVEDGDTFYGKCPYCNSPWINEKKEEE